MSTKGIKEIRYLNNYIDLFPLYKIEKQINATLSCKFEDYYLCGYELSCNTENYCWSLRNGTLPRDHLGPAMDKTYYSPLIGIQRRT